MLRVLLVLGMLPLAACSVGRDDPAIPISTERDVKRHLVGRDITANVGQSFRLTRNGTLVGHWNHRALLGRYEMRDGYFCRSVTAGPHGALPEECQVLVLRGDTLLVTRARGAGEAMIFHLK